MTREKEECFPARKAEGIRSGLPIAGRLDSFPEGSLSASTPMGILCRRFPMRFEEEAEPGALTERSCLHRRRARGSTKSQRAAEQRKRSLRSTEATEKAAIVGRRSYRTENIFSSSFATCNPSAPESMRDRWTRRSITSSLTRTAGRFSMLEGPFFTCAMTRWSHRVSTKESWPPQANLFRCRTGWESTREFHERCSAPRAQGCWSTIQRCARADQTP